MSSGYILVSSHYYCKTCSIAHFKWKNCNHRNEVSLMKPSKTSCDRRMLEKAYINIHVRQLGLFFHLIQSDRRQRTNSCQINKLWRTNNAQVAEVWSNKFETILRALNLIGLKIARKRNTNGREQTNWFLFFIWFQFGAMYGCFLLLLKVKIGEMIRISL